MILEQKVHRNHSYTNLHTTRRRFLPYHIIHRHWQDN
ncbi:hypothetical protein CP8484711_1454, partial [Chlamydia psittaci 84-8471/1]